MLQLGIWDGIAGQFFTLLVEIGVQEFLRSGELSLRFVAAAEAEKHLAADVVDILIVGNELFGGVEGGECFAIFSLSLVQAAEREKRSRLSRTKVQRLAKSAFGGIVVFHAEVEQSELFVRVGQIRFDGDVFLKFSLRALIILFLGVSDSQTKMDERQLGIRGGGEFEFGNGFFDFLPI